MNQSSSLPWWQRDDYEVTHPITADFTKVAGPKDLALVQAYEDGRTAPGWGREDFISGYNRGDFHQKRALIAYAKRQQPFAIVMRSVQMVCIDIDGKNGGFEHAKKLGMLPYTLAETSKSGNGYHLFYLVDDEWTKDYGFDGWSDHIGIVQGVDVRGIGCVYHYPTQRWNGREAVQLPQHLAQLMQDKKRKRQATAQAVAATIQTGDPLDMLMMHEELIADLNRPIADGKRNNTLFAIGQKMKLAQVKDWETHIMDRAVQIGLDDEEADKLVRNITNYN